VTVPETRDAEASRLLFARDLGRAICASAVWDDENRLCNWMGRSPQTTISSSVRVTALGADLYSGSAGLALALGALYAETGDDEFLRVATGALLRSVAYSQVSQRRTPRASSLSFFAGELGIIFCAAQIILYTRGRLQLQTQLDNLLSEVERNLLVAHPLDVVGGSAGAVPALLFLSTRLNRPELRDWAVRCGDQLCSLAIWDGAQCAWEPVVATGLSFAGPLAGFAHGASGISVALLELYALTGYKLFRDTARGSFNYEQTLFNEKESNWSDLRFVSSNSGNSPTVSPIAWCHGAAGIALARARAMELDLDQGSEHDRIARVALDTTKDALASLIQQCPSVDTSLCHGLSGLSEIIFTVGTIYEDSELIQIAMNAADSIVAQVAGAAALRSGLPDMAAHPSLMLGSAGVLHHLLRLISRPSISSVLLLSPSK